jgi:dTDP-glucose pyrophosphorylase
MKALVLSGGAGTRLRPITHPSAEQLVPVADKAVLFHGLESIADAGITQVLLTQVADPRAFGLAQPGPDGQVIGVEEKPQQPKSVHDSVRAIEPSWRGESEIIPGGEAEYSNVLPDASIEGVARVESSLIGRHVEVTPAPSVPRAHRLVPGDHSKVPIPS